MHYSSLQSSIMSSCVDEHNDIEKDAIDKGTKISLIKKQFFNKKKNQLFNFHFIKNFSTNLLRSRKNQSIRWSVHKWSTITI